MKNKNKTIKKRNKNKTRRGGANRGGTNRGEYVFNPLLNGTNEQSYANLYRTNNLFNTLTHMRQEEYLNTLTNGNISDVVEMAENEIYKPTCEESIMTGKSNKELHSIITTAINILNTRKSLRQSLRPENHYKI